MTNYFIYKICHALNLIGFHKELMYFKQHRIISTLSGKSLKLRDQFTYLGSNITSTENYINISMLLASYRSYENLISSQNKTEFLPSWGCFSTTVWIHHQYANEVHEEKALRDLLISGTSCFEHILEGTLLKTAVITPLTSHLTKGLSSWCNS